MIEQIVPFKQPSPLFPNWQLRISSPFGASDAMMFANGFTRRMLRPHRTCNNATREPEAGSRSIGRVRITEGG
jgi:hypothetical protein